MENRRGALLIFIITICSILVSGMTLCKPWLSKKEKQQQKANEFYGYNNYQMEYTFAKEDLYPRGVKFKAVAVGTHAPVSYAQAMKIISNGAQSGTNGEPPTLLKDLMSILKMYASELPEYAGYLFETPPISSETAASTQFEFVLLPAPGLIGARQDKETFSEHFSTGQIDGVIAFPNIGGDAHLVVPMPSRDISSGIRDYSSLAAFMRTAPTEQAVKFWRYSAYEMLSAVEQNAGKKSLDVDERPRRLLAPRQARFVAKVLQLRTLSQGLKTAYRNC